MGYHDCPTRNRSPVQVRIESSTFLFLDLSQGPAEEYFTPEIFVSKGATTMSENDLTLKYNDYVLFRSTTDNDFFAILKNGQFALQFFFLLLSLFLSHLKDPHILVKLALLILNLLESCMVQHILFRTKASLTEFNQQQPLILMKLRNHTNACMPSVFRFHFVFLSFL